MLTIFPHVFINGGIPMIIRSESQFISHHIVTLPWLAIVTNLLIIINHYYITTIINPYINSN